MQITITGQHLDLTDSIKNYADEKIGRLGRYFDHVSNAQVVLKHLPPRKTEQRRGYYGQCSGARLPCGGT